MKSDSLKQYVPLLEALLKEKAELEERLVQINQILGSLQLRGSAPSPAAGAPEVQQAPAAKKRAKFKRAKNKLSLRAAVKQVTTKKPMTKAEILEAVQNKLGYKFASSNPVNSLNAVLYAKNQFKNVEGRFGPV